MACNSCKQKTNGNEKMKTSIVSNNSKFAFRTNLGNVNISSSDNESITNSNLTDELAIEFLRENPNRITMFEKYPENWEAMLTDKTETGQDEN